MNYKLPSERKSKTIIFACREDFFNDLEKYCIKKDMTKSMLIRRLLEKEIYDRK